MTTRTALATALTATALLAPAAQAMIPGDDGAPAPSKPTVMRLPRVGGASRTTTTKPTRRTAIDVVSPGIQVPYHVSVAALRRNDY
jgi:hypothetical protein